MSDILQIKKPTIEILDNENEYHRIKIVFPIIDNDGNEQYIRGGILKFRAESFPIHDRHLSDLVTIQFRTGFEERDGSQACKS